MLLFAQWSQSSYIWHTAEAQISKLLVFLACHTVGATQNESHSEFFFFTYFWSCFILARLRGRFNICILGQDAFYGIFNGASSATCDFTSCHFSQQDHPVATVSLFLFCFLALCSEHWCHVEAGKARPLPRCPMTLIHITDSLLL